MIGFGTGSGEYGTLAPAVFAFQNQLDSLLEEELVLLRGRDDGQATVVGRPVYNRLFWNFTTNEGEAAYQVNYNITDQDLNGIIDEADAKVLFPQGHGDAWGHYLTAITTTTSCWRHPFFTWNPGGPEAVDGRWRTGPGRLPRRAQVRQDRGRQGEGRRRGRRPDLPAQLRRGSRRAVAGVQDTEGERAWGLSEWGRRAGQGAYFDWVVV